MVIYMSDNNNYGNNSSNENITLSDAEARRSVDDFFGTDARDGLTPLREGYDFGIKKGFERIFASKNEE